MMQNNSNSNKIAFQVTVSQLSLSFPLLKKDIRVTISVSDVSKVTCAGVISEDGLSVTWNHPFLFNEVPTTPVLIAIWVLPERLTPGWNKQSLGDQMLTDVAGLLKSGSEWQCNVPGMQDGSKTLFMKCSASNVLIPPPGHNCVLAMQSYASKLSKLRREFKSLPAISVQIQVRQAILDFCPKGHTWHTGLLDGLANSFRAHYKLAGNILDLHRAVELNQTRLGLCSPSHPEYPDALEGLALSLWESYMIQGNEADLNRVIEMREERLALCPFGHPDHMKALGHLAISLIDCYHLKGDAADLNRAIGMQQKRLDFYPSNHPEYLSALGNLAASLNIRYHKQNNLADLEKAMELEERRLALCPSGHPKRGVALQNLAHSLKDHFSVQKVPSNLTRAIGMLKEALASYPPHHKFYAGVIQDLADTILLGSPVSHHFQALDQQPFPQIQEAFETYRLLKNCNPAVSIDLWNANQSWLKNAEKHNHSSVLEAYQTSLNTLDHFTSIQSSLASRHEVMQAKVTNLANNAFSCAVTKHANFSTAVELLERGRGILWNQLANCDIFLVALLAQGNLGKMFVKKFTQLSENLRRHAGGSDDGMDPYWQVKKEWQSVVDEIRRQDGFSQFLSPPRFEDLRKAADSGPVIIVNTSEYTCDALIILRTRSPVHVPLDCTLGEIAQLRSRLSDVILACGQIGEPWVKQLLRDLWSTVVEPIITVLKDEIKLPLGSRIWWCPTSKSSFLPLHAAGPYRKGNKNLVDLYVSSYTPSLSSLIRARERVHQKKKTVTALENGDVVPFAVVGQAQPSADQQLPELPKVESEIQKIRNETNMPLNVSLKTIVGDAATVEGALQAFRDHRWVHLACHGAQHSTKPFESWFAMKDGPLTLMRIIQEHYTHSEFAFLSACHTAVGDESTPDEVLHLAAGMQFAGFSGVIGTLWSVDDTITHEVVTRFYQEMFKRPVIDSEHAAEALNTAVVESAKEVPLEKRIVFVHIGI